MKPDVPLECRSPFHGLPDPQTPGDGVVLEYRDQLGLAAACARHGRTVLLAERLRERFGIELPLHPGLTRDAMLSIAGLGPDRWLLMQEGEAAALAESMERVCGADAAVTDLSDAYAVMRLSGPKVRAALAKLVPLDLHERAFEPGAFASTETGHTEVMLWRLADDAGAAVFEIAVPRSFCASFWHSLCESTAEFGLRIRRR